MWANFFPELSLEFFSSSSKLLNSSSRENYLVEKILFFWRNSYFSDHFQLLSKIFKTFDQFFSSRLSIVPLLCPDEVSQRKIYFLLKKFSSKIFPESALTMIGFSAIFFNRDVKNAVNLSKKPIEKSFSVKKCLLKFSLQLWGRFFETICKRDLKAAF